MARLFALALLVSFSILCACTTGFRQRNLLVIGDSNGERAGWVYQLQQIRGGGPLVNTSVGGNTVGFNYDGNRALNTLENLTSYLRKGYAEMGGIDEILICLGTNDCKARFSDQHGQIGGNLTRLLTDARAFFTERGQQPPRFVLLTPPPMDDTKVDEFAGGEACIAELTRTIRAFAADEDICLVDLQQNPGEEVLKFSKDGIHFDAAGYKLWAEAIVERCY